jgi:sporulation integral membrane protein YlbJ
MKTSPLGPGKFIFLAAICFILISFIMFPQKGLDAALQGIHIWWDVLFPALFPFFVISEMLLGFGLVHFFGALLDPMMRPVFRIPGSGGFVMAMGFAAGYPVSARLTSQLWHQRLINREEGERLVAFTTTSDPIFLIGAVAIGFFHDAGLALILACAHYGGAVLVGLIMRYHGMGTPSPTKKKSKPKQFILSRAFDAMHQARLEDGRPLGLLLRQAVQTSIQLVFVIGGLVVLFSVFLEFMNQAGLMLILYALIGQLLQWIQIPELLSQAVVNGLFEVTLGSKTAGAASIDLALKHKAAIAAFVLSWSGLSVHAQILSVLNQTNLRYGPFFIARLIHGILSTLLVYMLWKPLEALKDKTTLALPSQYPYEHSSFLVNWYLQATLFVFASSLALIVVLFLIYRIFKFIQR